MKMCTVYNIPIKIKNQYEFNQPSALAALNTEINVVKY